MHFQSNTSSQLFPGFANDPNAPALFFFVPASSSGQYAQDVAGTPPSLHRASLPSDTSFNTFPINALDGRAPTMCAVNQFIPVNAAAVHPMPSLAPTYYSPSPATSHTSQSLYPCVQPVTCLAPGSVPQAPPPCPPAPTQVTYMIMSPSPLNQDTAGHFQYPTSAHPPSMTLPPVHTTAPVPFSSSMTFIQSGDVHNYPAGKRPKDSVTHLNGPRPFPTFTAPSASMNSATTSSNGNSFTGASQPPPYVPNKTTFPVLAASLTSVDAAAPPTTGRSSDTLAASDGTRLAQKDQPATLSTTLGARSFVAPAPVGSRFVPNTSLIMSIPPLARRIPKWGVIPTRSANRPTAP